MFNTILDRDCHLRSDTLCLKKDYDGVIWTVDESQRSQIQTKTRGGSDEQKWKEIYRVIFKIDSASEVPSPCERDYQPRDLRRDMLIQRFCPDSTIEMASSLAAFESYLRRRMQQDEDGSAAEVGLDLLQDFCRYQRSSPSTVSTSEAPPSLTWEPDANTSTETFASHETLHMTEIGSSHAHAGFMPAEHTNDIDFDDPEFMDRFNNVFMYNTNSIHYQLDPSY